MVRRKSDAKRELIDCRYHREAEHERTNQVLHEQRMAADPEHDTWSPCWCCCIDCPDLHWYHEELSSPPTPSGAPPPTPGTSAG